MAINVGKLLGKPLAWAASLGTGVVSAFVVWVLSVWLFHPDAVMQGIIVTVAAKFAGWLVSEYGPKPAAPVAPNIDSAPRR